MASENLPDLGHREAPVQCGKASAPKQPYEDCHVNVALDEGGDMWVQHWYAYRSLQIPCLDSGLSLATTPWDSPRALCWLYKAPGMPCSDEWHPAFRLGTYPCKWVFIEDLAYSVVSLSPCFFLCFRTPGLQDTSGS